MTNKEFILKISDRKRDRRVEKILSYCTRPYEVQSEDGLDNIILPARDPHDKIVIMAHHDVYPGSHGYNDNSTGVVTLLKLQNFLPDNVELVFTDEEEYGGLGCSLYLRKCPRPKMAINVDVVGLGDKVFYENYADQGKIQVAPSMMLYKDIPFSDSRILEREEVPNILMLTGHSESRLIGDIFSAQHGGKKDGDLSIISEDIMNKVFTTVLDVVRRNNGK